MPLVTLIIGNSDDKLGQRRWSAFVTGVGDAVRDAVGADASAIHFAGFSAPDKPWQNACWVFDLDHRACEALRAHLRVLAGTYYQDAVAWIESKVLDFLHGEPVDR